MNILVCIKRVPFLGTKIILTDDKQEIQTQNLSFTIGPHEECAIEEAIQLKEKHGGHITVLSVGENLASEQLRHAIAMGVDEAILLETDGDDWDAMAISHAISETIRDKNFDLFLFGNESADSNGYQVGIRIAHTLGLSCISGIKSIEISDGFVKASRPAYGGMEIYKIPLPAVISVKEGINLPRYPSLPGRMRARRKEIDIIKPVRVACGLEKIHLEVPDEGESNVQILGNDIDVVPKVIKIFQELKVI